MMLAQKYLMDEIYPLKEWMEFFGIERKKTLLLRRMEVEFLRGVGYDLNCTIDDYLEQSERIKELGRCK